MALPAEFVHGSPNEPGFGLLGSEGSIAIAQPAEDQLELLVREHARLIYRIGFSVLRNPHDAEDVVQEVFMRVVRSRHRLRDVTDAKAYLARTAWHVALDSRRRHNEVSIDATLADEVSPAAVVAELHATGASLEQIASDRQMLRFVEDTIAELPSDLRDAIRLATIEELSAAEAGQVLGVAEATVRTRVFRARQILREKLADILERRHAREA
jgi:RNA polymerase sigma-70 factor (ECF subfamily)